MAYSHKYYENHREKFLAANKKYIEKKKAENNKEFLEKQAAYMRDYYRSHPEQKEKKKQYDKEWRKNHTDYFKNYKKRKAGENNEKDKCNL